MIATRAPKRRRRPIHETVSKLGRQHDLPRWFCAARYLERAGFKVDLPIELVPGDGKLVIRPSDEDTGKRVNPRKRGRQTVPVIDLNQQLLEDVFGDAERVHVRVAENEIILSLDPIEKRRAERPRDGSIGALYPGAGLMDWGAVQADPEMRVDWAVEIDPTTADYYRQNHPDVTVYEMSVADAVYSDLTPVETLLVGQPCQPWSGIRTTIDNKGTRPPQDAPDTYHPAGGLVFFTVLVLAMVNPRTVILENVPGFAKSETGEALRRALIDMGYRVEVRVLDSHDYGAITSRVRTVLVAQTPEEDGTVPSPWPEERPNENPLSEWLDEEEDAHDFEWWDRTTREPLFKRAEKAGSGDRGFAPGAESPCPFPLVSPEDTRIPTITSEYGNVKPDSFVLAHPNRPDTYRWLTQREGRRVMGVPEDYVLPKGRKPSFELLGQAVYAPLFRDIVQNATGRNAEAPRLEARSPDPFLSVEMSEAPEPTAVAAEQAALDLFAN